MLFTIFEILDIAVMTFVIGYLFHDIFRKPQKAERDVLEYYQKKRPGPFGIEWQDFWWASALVAPTILVHELGHKFTALGFGLNATFHAACSTASFISGGFLDFYCGLTIITVILKAIGFGFLFFVPAFVSVGAGGTHLQYAIVAFAGPFIHLVLWLGTAHILKNQKRMRKMPHKRMLYLYFFKQINMFLFILNMIPIPGFDGFNFLINLIRSLG